MAKSGDSEHFRSGKQVRCPHADVSGEGGSGYRQRACEVEFPRATSALEISVDGRHRHLFRGDGDPGSSTDACAATRIDQFHTDLDEEVEPAHAFGQGFDLARAVLDVEIHTVLDRKPCVFGRLADLSVVGDVVHFTGRA